MSQPVTAQKTEKRVPGIDLLRGFSIVAVVLHHINLRLRFNHSALGQMIGENANRVLFWSGYYGVIVFFVISGFLITTWSFKRWGALGAISRRQFYRMRFARIVPCLLALLAVLSLLDRLGVPRFVINPQHTSLGRALLAALIFHVNWLEARTGYLPASWDVLWSLSVEEVFYIFFPLLCTLLYALTPRPRADEAAAQRSRAGEATIIAVLCCFLVIGPWARVHKPGLWADYGYLSCMDGIALGCLAAMATAKLRLSGKANLAARMAGSALCLLIVVFRPSASAIGFYKLGLDVTVLELGTALLLIGLQLRFERRLVRAGASAADATRAATDAASLWREQFATAAQRGSALLFRSTAFLRWFGRNSYEVYLTHMFVIWPMFWLFQYFGVNINAAVWFFLITTALAGLLGWLVARFYSEPMNHRLRSGMAFVDGLPRGRAHADAAAAD